MNVTTITWANPKEEEAIRNLLREAGLPHEDISPHLHRFLVAKSHDTLIGVVGLEVQGKYGLLRSLAVSPAYRGKGIGKMLYERILAHAFLQGIKELCLLTTTADGFFYKFGFGKVERGNIPEPIQATEEFQTLCPSTAICMMKRIDREVQYYPKEVLCLQPDVPGAKMWGVALEKAMLTYFEVEPNSQFEKHSHESEQITMVLEGELFFEVTERMISVKEGEVIAIPSNISHAVFTQGKPVKAVDAWSPVIEKYKK